jgi:outer membrane protein W
MGNLRVKFPYTEKLSPYVGAGLGWAMAWEDVFIAADSTTEKIDDVNFFNGFGANANIGVLLPLGSKSDVYFETFYNWSNCKRNKKETDAGIFGMS